MSKKRKISVRKIIQVLITLVVTSACIVAVLSASKIEDTKKLAGIDVQISNEKTCHFLDKNELLKTLTDKQLEGLPIKKLDIGDIEDSLHANCWTGDAQVYIDNARMMHVCVTQRVPVARIFEASGNSYYLDTTLNPVPLSTKYVYYTVAVTNVPHMIDDSAGNAMKASIIKLVRTIEKDTFWNAMVSQIMVDSVYGFQLMPVLGNHIIMLGDTSRLKEKLNNVFLFYKNILNNIGWAKYEILDVRFKGQLVASPALQYKAPGKVLSNMDWVKSMIEQGAKNEGLDSAVNKKTIKIPVEKAIKDTKHKVDTKDNKKLTPNTNHSVS